eukprot:scaffold5717_cov112-Isochrysis_galbana.AAC.11
MPIGDVTPAAAGAPSAGKACRAESGGGGGGDSSPRTRSVRKACTAAGHDVIRPSVDGSRPRPPSAPSPMTDGASLLPL